MSEPRIILGLRVNWRQFALLAVTNAFVGAMVGLECTIVPLIAKDEFAIESSLIVLSFLIGFGVTKALPVETGWADVVISNGLLNLVPDKMAALQEMARVLKPGGRLQIGDILVRKAVPESARRKIELWTG